MVAGEIERDGAIQVPAGASVEVDGKETRLPGLRVVAFHKPPGLVTAARDPLPTIYSVLPFGPDTLLPVGRLDRETEGLLLLTNDGALLHRLTDPKRHVEKEYVALLERPADADSRARLRGELDLGRGEISRAARDVEALAPDCVRLVIDEGKYHQVRRMFVAIGNRVTRLTRTRVGFVGLAGLASGAWRELEANEVARLRADVGFAPSPSPTKP
jgi:16S rRNA pseudouridine516 synthase